MIVLDSIGWWNTGLPLAVLVVLALLLPRFLISKKTRSHWVVVRGLLATALLLLLAGFALSMVVTQARGFDVEAHMMRAPAVGFWLHLRLSLLAAIVWAPVLALVGFGQAQAVEARRGRDMVLADRNGE